MSKFGINQKVYHILDTAKMYLGTIVSKRMGYGNYVLYNVVWEKPEVNPSGDYSEDRLIGLPREANDILKDLVCTE